MSSSSHRGIYGDTTGELHTAWLNKVAATKAGVQDQGSGPGSSELTMRPETLPHEALQPLFNDVLLYPSKSQVFEMVQCARECSNQVRISPLRTLRNTNTRWAMSSDSYVHGFPLPSRGRSDYRLGRLRDFLTQVDLKF